jgi:hypothetical protein
VVCAGGDGGAGRRVRGWSFAYCGGRASWPFTLFHALLVHARPLPAADGGDEKARSTLARLVQFRSFYMVIVGYLYVSRVLVFVLAETLPYTRTWVAPFFEEAATLAFYAYAGWRFRPAPDNSDYFSVPAVSARG